MTPIVEEYVVLAKAIIKPSGYCGPHCDPNVLHLPGECSSCDMPEFVNLHELRATMRINWTGTHYTDWELCPAEQQRPLDLIQQWSGNVVADEDYHEDWERWHQEVDRLLEKASRNRGS